MTTCDLSLQQSMHEILSRSKDRLGDLFYQCLFEKHPELLGYFEQVDVPVQATMLVNALHVIAAHAAHRHAATGEYLKVLGHRHCLRQIPLDAYPKFNDVMLAALARFHGPDWCPDCAEAWKSALEVGIAAMQDGYLERSVTY